MFKKLLPVFIVIDTIFIVGLAAFFLVTTNLIQSTKETSVQDQKRIGEGEAIFVLAYWAERGNISEMYRVRLEKAYELWQQLRKPVWILGGKVFDEPYSNSYYAKQYLLQKGLPEKWIKIYDDFPFLGQSVDTFTEVESAVQLVKKFNIKNLVVISDSLQLAQVKVIFNSANIYPILVTSEEAGAVFSRPDCLRYELVRRAALTVALIDKKGKVLFWVRSLRTSGRQHKLQFLGI